MARFDQVISEPSDLAALLGLARHVGSSPELFNRGRVLSRIASPAARRIASSFFSGDASELTDAERVCRDELVRLAAFPT